LIHGVSVTEDGYLKVEVNFPGTFGIVTP
jgi:hypothetical protein